MAIRIQQSSLLRLRGRPLKSVENLKGPSVVSLTLLLVIWVGVPLIPEERGFSFELGYQFSLTAIVVLGAVVFRLLQRDRGPLPRRLVGVIGVLGSLIIVYLLTLGLLILVGVFHPQVEQSSQTQTVSEISWTEEAEARLEKVPPFIRRVVQRTTEEYALRHGYLEVTPDVLTEARENAGEP